LYAYLHEQCLTPIPSHSLPFSPILSRDLYLLFRKYGTILSVHTMINKSTGLSKGYGFVSYSARDEALAAIGAMDGFRVRPVLTNPTCI